MENYNNPQTPSGKQSTPTLKRIALIIACLLVVGTLAVGVVALLKNITPTASHQSDSKAITPAEEVVNAIKAPGAIKSLEDFILQNNPPGVTPVIYKADGRTYTISTPAKESVLFVAKTPGPLNSSAGIEEEITKFIVEKGYEKTENTGAATSTSPTYTTFKSSIGICQLAHQQPATAQLLAFYEIACTDSTAISQEYSGLEMLLTIYKETGPALTFTSASRSNVTEDNKALSIVNLTGDNTKALLLFAAIDNNWEFIGDLNDKDATSNGKYSVSAEVRSKINNARYGNFLKNYIP
jgi:hypothetical protein